MSRTFGIKFGIITFIIDCFKGFLSVKVFSWFFASYFSYFWGEFAGYLVGIAIILGHNYPLIFKFKGGKGFASVIGIFLAINPLMTVITLTGCLIVLFITDIMSTYAISFFTATMMYTCFISDINWSMKICTIVYFVLGVVAHRSNINNFLKGKERKLGIKSKILKKLNKLKEEHI